MSADRVSDHLPLRPVELHVLLSLGDGERHGYGIMKDAAERTGEAVIPDVATLYRALRRMVENGLIQPAERRSLEGKNRNYYRITPLGVDVAKAESNRLRVLVDAAREGGFLAGG